MGKKLIYLLRGKLHIYPPCVSQIYMLTKYIDDIVVITSFCDVNLMNDLMNCGVKVVLIGDIRLNKGIFGKISSYLYFRSHVLRKIKYEDKNNTTLWFGSADSAIALIGKLEGWNYIVNSLELYDKNFVYRNGLSYIVNKTRGLVVCEYNRAYIMKSWWGLKSLPYIMPNKPYYHPQNRNIPCEEAHLINVITQMKVSKAIIYQGLIMWSSNHIITIAHALAEIGENYCLVLLGNNNEKMYEEIKKIYDRTINVKYIPAPKHLIITSYAYIGVATYDEISLNNLYCAPNKIYEYAGFGIPMLCSDIPGLRYTIGYNCAGECLDLKNIEKVKKAIKMIDENYEEYSKNSKRFFDSTDNTVVLEEIISKTNIK